MLWFPDSKIAAQAPLDTIWAKVPVWRWHIGSHLDSSNGTFRPYCFILEGVIIRVEFIFTNPKFKTDYWVINYNNHHLSIRSWLAVIHFWLTIGVDWHFCLNWRCVITGLIQYISRLWQETENDQQVPRFKVGLIMPFSILQTDGILYLSGNHIPSY